VTRRAPPLESDSRHSTTETPVHRPQVWWTGWLALTALCITLSGCKVLPEIQFARTLPLSRSRAAIDIESSQGVINRAERVRLSRQLAATGETSLLDYHLAAMQDLGAPPLLTGNRVELLIDGPRTYEAMFGAIEKAREFVLVESFIFEEASSGDRTLSRLLTEAVGRGVRVYVLYDAVGSLTTDEGFLDHLGGAGIALCAFNPVNPLDVRFAGLNQRDHR
jgi:cardiolipin synthase